MASATRLGKPCGFCGCGRQRVRKRRPATLWCTVPEGTAGLHDHTTPGRGAEAGERGRSEEPATATPRSQTQPGGHEAVKRRPQADNPFSVDLDVGRGLTPALPPPGKAATPSEPGKERDAGSRASL
ncbi:hypothetical protein PO856_000625 [Pectobacterium brasiliense]|uniref:hypothetical protein n=1 Tax=Pectobacterium brasiliense TaxID=180957 RepID=UPI002404A544|nr:hypothetical protein [Pectobacterium brasiliense]MDG0807537.1 hypothetical protein [Pectobacterium brasiliense]MDG0807544.1 hypothetical protein [Pectobacterium brasiliense]